MRKERLDVPWDLRSSVAVAAVIFGTFGVGIGWFAHSLILASGQLPSDSYCESAGANRLPLQAQRRLRDGQQRDDRPSGGAEADPLAGRFCAEELRQCAFERDFLRGRLTTHEGVLAEWPDDVRADYRYERLRGLLEASLSEHGATVSLDCAEFPCIMAAVASESDMSSVTDAYRSIPALQDRVETRTAFSIVGDRRVFVTGVSDRPLDPEAQIRMEFRLDTFLQHIRAEEE